MTQPDSSHASSSSDASQGVRYVDAGDGDAGQRVDNYLMRLFRTVPKSHVYRVLRTGQVRVNGKRAKAEQRLVAGDRLRIPPLRIEAKPPQERPSLSLQKLITEAIIHEDRDFLVVNKPAGIAVHGGSGLAHGVIEALRLARAELSELELVHRIDRDTSGLLLVAKRRAALRELHASLREREMTKRYLALVNGRWNLGKKRLELPLITNQKQGGERVVRVDPAGQAALSVFSPKEHFGKLATLMEVEIGTGRTHQIRVHAAYAGHPVAGDEKYGNKAGNEVLKAYGLRRMFLHAHSLEFVHPGTKQPFSIKAPLDAELEAVLAKLRESGGKRG